MLIKVQQNRQEDGAPQSREILLIFVFVVGGGGFKFFSFPPTYKCLHRFSEIVGPDNFVSFQHITFRLGIFFFISLIRSSSCVGGFSPAGTGQKSKKKKEERSIDFIYNTIAPEQSFR